MINLKKISLFELPDLIGISYKNDTDLFEKYHIDKVDFVTAVNSTFGMILTASKIKKLSYYKVIFQKQAIGYVVTYDNCLYSYAIAMRFREKGILAAWMDKIKKLFNQHVVSMIYENNIRAGSFLEKNGFEKINNIHGVVTYATKSI